ncbi:LysR family transcriptional regulator [Bacteriovorax sp. PP10]|uniref:LysR family transcriptional regulator n=1 Tax=Bacteriovorax antarcticus TaxID=3088717 RepID=A0ABU5VY22_9BACT|nr:LysR family transcriptional regulator [Bacteriovorax sp. PP10]MEA9357936.1 LysR family transcriptional regulator [Bacteriovorax sp. PP10]
MLDFRYLKAFMLTAKYSSFSKAAEELNIAQSAVSRQIKLLEDSLQEELIIRSSKKVILSEKGKELYQASQSFEKTSLQIFQREDQLPLSIGILEGLLKNWFTPLLTDYLKNQKRDVTVHVADMPELKSGIEESKFDVIFGVENIQSELVTSLKLFEEKLVLISKNEINRKKLNESRWVVFSNNDHLFKLSKTKSESIVMVDSFSSIISLVKNDVGIAVVPDHLIRKEDQLKVQEFPGLPSSQIYLSTLNYKKMPERIQALCDIVKKK